MFYGIKKDLSEFSKEERVNFATKLLEIAPHTIDVKTLHAKKENYIDTVNKMNTCEQHLSKSQSITVDGVQVESLYRFAQMDFKKCSEDLKYFNEGCAWHCAVHGLADDDVSNSVIDGYLTNLMKQEMENTYSAVAPAWYEKIVNSILDITGVDIRISQYN